MNRNVVYEVMEQKMCPGGYSFPWDGTVNTGDYGYPPEEGSNIAPAGLYTFDVEVEANPYDKDAVRSKALRVDSMFVEDLGVNEATGEYIYLVQYSLMSEYDALQGILYLYDGSILTSVQSWNVSELLCTEHNLQDSLTASSQGRQHTLVVRVPENILEVGRYYFILYFIDNTKYITRNHINKSLLHVGQIIDVVYQTEDTIFSEILKAFASPDESQTINLGGHPCPPHPNTLPLVPDINGDGVNDWDYPGDVKIPGTNYVIGVFGIKKGIWNPNTRTFRNLGSYYYVAIGVDDNNNGLLDRSEIRHQIGQCPYPYGVNMGWIEKAYDGRWYVHWTSYNDRVRIDADPNRPGYQPKRDYGEPLRHFIYDPYRNILKVYLNDGYGNIVTEYQGSPAGYPYWLR
mgnify:FL=1